MKTLKGKISFGVIFLFTVILLLSISGIIFINKLAQKSKGTITDNYSSVDYTMNMISSLESIYNSQLRIIREKTPADVELKKSYIASKNIFEKNLQLETNNITEKGEGVLVNKLHLDYGHYLNLFDRIRNDPRENEQQLKTLRDSYMGIKNEITEIYRINIAAISRKSNELQRTADDVIIYMLIAAGVSVLIALLFLFTFPSKIAGPIKELTQKIKSISERNYDQKLDINTKDELGELSKAFNTMVERLKIYEAKQIDRLLFEQKRLEAVVHSFEDGILLVDENRRIVLANDTILQLSGLKEGDISNKLITEAAEHNDLIKEIYKTVQKKISNGDTGIKPIRIAKDGRESYFNIESEEIITYSELEKKEIFIGNLILLKNITKFQERDKAKTNLLATASHELKTPLSSINLSLKLLDDKRFGSLNKDQKEVLNSLRQQSSRLSKVINELLDYSQIETGNIKLTFSTVKPDAVLDIGITALMMQISEKVIDLKTCIEEDLPEIRVDLEKAVFVFINILNNALRYSKREDEIIIEVKKINNSVEFSIKDNGPGISKEDQEKLFQRFTQVGNSSKQGWGLGLAISKEFMEAQNGKIWIESETGKGSKFIFSFPAA
jgi:PAS domain S-box-containing protein